MAAANTARQGLRVFVGNLPWTIGSTELRHFASSFGPVTYSQVIFDKKTGLSKGFGFVGFGTRDGFNAITKGGNGAGVYLLEGQHVNVSTVNYSNQQSGAGVSGGDE